MANIKRYKRQVLRRTEATRIMNILMSLGVAFSLQGLTFYIDESETTKLPTDENGFYLPTTEELDTGFSMFEVYEEY